MKGPAACSTCTARYRAEVLRGSESCIPRCDENGEVEADIDQHQPVRFKMTSGDERGPKPTECSEFGRHASSRNRRATFKGLGEKPGNNLPCIRGTANRGRRDCSVSLHVQPPGCRLWRQPLCFTRIAAESRS